MKWRLNAEHALHFRSWDDDFLVYDSFSGDTHLIGDVAAQLLQNLRSSPLDVRSLCEALAATFAIENNEDFTAEIESLISDLKGLGLIEACE